ncbi:MAG: cation:dicarboxylase symporter family transporter [Calditrichia bacterium]
MIKLKPFNVLHWVYFLLSTVISLYLFSQPATNVMADWPGVVQFVRSALLMFALYLMFQKLFEMELHTKIILGMILGGFAGFIYGNEIVEVKPVGTAFIRLIQMIVVPLVLASLISGTASLGDIKKMKRDRQQNAENTTCVQRQWRYQSG